VAYRKVEIEMQDARFRWRLTLDVSRRLQVQNKEV